MNRLRGAEQVAWTARRYAFVGIFAALFFILWGVAKLVVSIGLGLGTGGPMNFFTFPMLAVFAAHVRPEKGAMVLPVLVFSVLVLPLPALGQPWFIFKVPTLVIPFLVAESLFWLLKKRPAVASTASGALASFLVAFFIVNVLRSGVSPVVYLIGLVEGGTGGFVGRIRRSRVRRQSRGSNRMASKAHTTKRGCRLVSATGRFELMRLLREMMHSLRTYPRLALAA